MSAAVFCQTASDPPGIPIQRRLTGSDRAADGICVSACEIGHMVLIFWLNLAYGEAASAPDGTNPFPSRRRRPNRDRMMSFCWLEAGELLRTGLARLAYEAR